MLTFDIDLLTGRYIATGEATRNSVEWPPHPARVFSALVATWADGAAPNDDERAALEWLECQPAPEIHASPATEGRTPVTHFVPVNDMSVIGISQTSRRWKKLEELHAALNIETDESRRLKLEDKIRVQRDVSAVTRQNDSSKAPTKDGLKAAIAMLPERIGARQPRSWSSITPQVSRVSMVWADASPSDEITRTLDDLSARVVRIGHSSSLVSMRVHREAPGSDERWVPDPSGKTQLRWIQVGQLAALERKYVQHQGNRARTLPKKGVAYRSPAEVDAVTSPVAQSRLGGEWYVLAFEKEKRTLPSSYTQRVADVARNAIMSHSQDPPNVMISGHNTDGSKSLSPHMSVLPLPYVGSSYSSGLIMGIAIQLPRDVDMTGRAAVREALARWHEANFRLRLGSLGDVQLESRSSDLKSLLRDTWSRPSSVWVTATPIALPRHPGELRRGTPTRIARGWQRAEASVALACEQAGLPTPISIGLSSGSLLRGVEHVAKFGNFSQAGRRKVLMHARIEFGDKVEGPLVLGSGQFYGLGLMWPLAARDAS